MIRIGRMHPVANWIRCQRDEYTWSMYQVLVFQDQNIQKDPSTSGLPLAAMAWFWNEKLPQFLQQPHYQRQAEAHLDSLKLKSEDIGEMIERVAGQLLTHQADTDLQINQLQTVMESTRA